MLLNYWVSQDEALWPSESDYYNIISLQNTEFLLLKVREQYLYFSVFHLKKMRNTYRLDKH